MVKTITMMLVILDFLGKVISGKPGSWKVKLDAFDHAARRFLTINKVYAIIYKVISGMCLIVKRLTASLSNLSNIK
jgi:hypothetical protein